DSETVDVRQPWTLLAAAADQLSAQIPAIAGSTTASVNEAFADFRDALATFRANRANAASRTVGDSQADRAGLSASAEDTLSAGFGALLQVAAAYAATTQMAKDVPAVIILDTFEEVIYRTNEDLVGLWRLLVAVQEVFPALRIIIAGRTKPRPFYLDG